MIVPRGETCIEKLRAHAILDDVRCGIDRTREEIDWALRTLGEPVGVM